MNQDQVKALLLKVEKTKTEFSLIFSGKESAVVNGLYKPESREIILHNRNFASEDELIYTALHEYAHHLHYERKGGLVSGRAHTNEFWSIFQELLTKAESKNLYRSIFDTEPEFLELTRAIKENCLPENGRLMLEFGKLMIRAQELCAKHRTRFEDYLDRVLGLPRVTASQAQRAVSYNLDPKLGWEGMKLAAGYSDAGIRSAAIQALGGGMSPAAVKARFARAQASDDPAERLAEEKARLERNIKSLKERLAEVELRLAELERA